MNFGIGSVHCLIEKGARQCRNNRHMNTHQYNSAALKKEFPEIYKDFFSSATTAASAPASFCWGGYYAVYFGVPFILQQLPLRTYVGLKDSRDGKITVEKSTHFLPRKRIFESVFLEPSSQDALTKFLYGEIDKLTLPVPRKTGRGLTITILTEVTVSSGLNASGSLAAALACAFLLHLGKITPAQIRAWEIHLPDFKNDPAWNEVFRLAWKIEIILQHGTASGAGAFVPFISTRSPVVYMIEKQYASGAVHIPMEQLVAQGDLGFIDDIQYVGFPLTRFDPDQKSFHFPFNICLISLGFSRERYFSELIVQEHERVRQETSRFYREIFFPRLTSPERAWLHLDSEKISSDLSQYFLDARITVVLEIVLNMMKSLLACNALALSIGALQTLSTQMNELRWFMGCFRPGLPDVELLIAQLQHKVRIMGFGDEVLGVGASSIGLGGHLLCVYSEHLGEKFPAILEKVKQENDNFELNMDWISARDGFEGRGVVVEQHLASSLRSPFVSRGTVEVITLDDHGLSKTLYSLEEFTRCKSTFEVLLDASRNEIWIQGEKITSKEIRTAVATIAVVRVLIEHPRTRVSKEQMPQSRYIADRNEFQSKIVSPLVKAIEKRLGKRINFNVEGSIVNFTVQFDPQGVTFYCIDKIA